MQATRRYRTISRDDRPTRRSAIALLAAFPGGGRLQALTRGKARQRHHLPVSVREDTQPVHPSQNVQGCAFLGSTGRKGRLAWTTLILRSRRVQQPVPSL